jgi:hypothetical protein
MKVIYVWIMCVLFVWQLAIIINNTWDVVRF